MSNSIEFSAAKAAYISDGQPDISMVLNDQGLRLCMYKWNIPASVSDPSEKPKGLVLLIHGVTSHARFEYLYHPQCREMNQLWAKKKTEILMAMKAKRGPIEKESSSSEEEEMSENEESSEIQKSIQSRTSLTRAVHINPSGDYDEHVTSKGVGLGKKEVPILNSKAYEVSYDESWVQSLNQQKLVVYALDLQSHGLSDGWNNNRCNVERFDNFAEDVISVMHRIRTEYPEGNAIPLFAIGISMGGLVLVRTLEIGSSKGLFKKSNKYLSGAVLLAPALSIAKIKEKPANKLAMPLGKFLSKALPAIQVAAKQPNLRYYHIEQLCLIDPLVYKKRMRARLSMELVEGMEIAHNEACKISSDIAILICHSDHDTMCDPEGSKQLMEKLKVEDKQLWQLDDMWHFLTKEPGTQQLLSNIVEWINQHIEGQNSKTEGTS